MPRTQGKWEGRHFRGPGQAGHPVLVQLWNSLREKDCSSIKHDPTQSFFSTLDLRSVFRKWFSRRLERIYTAKFVNPQGYREPYSRRIYIMDVRIFLIPKQEHPPTIKANGARSTRKLVARGTRKLVAVTLITELKVYLTQQFRGKTSIARKS